MRRGSVCDFYLKIFKKYKLMNFTKFSEDDKKFF